MEIKIPTAKDKRFRWFIEILDCIKPFRELRPREKDVLAELYRVNSENLTIPIEQRNKIVFHVDTRKQIAENIGISMDSVYNIMTALRKKGILTESGFNDKFIVGDTDIISFRFIVNS